MQTTLQCTVQKNSSLGYKLVMNFYFLALALFSSLISVYLMEMGFSAVQAGTTVSAAFIASLLTQPFFGPLAEKFGIRRLGTILFSAALAGGLLFMRAKSLPAIVILYSTVLLLMNGMNPLIESLAASSPFHYGKIRIWGTIGYSIGAQAAGILYDRISPAAVYGAFAAAVLFTVIGFLLIEPNQENHGVREKQKEGSPAEQKTGWSVLFRNRSYLFYLLIYALFSGCSEAGNTFIPAQLKELGLNAGMVSTILCLSCLVQSPLVLYSSKIMNRFSVRILGIVSIGLTLAEMAVLAFSIPLSCTILIILLTKTTGVMLFIMLNLKIVGLLVPRRAVMRGLALIAAGKNLTAVLFNQASGWIVQSAGYSGLCLLLTLILVLSAVLFAFLKMPEEKNRMQFS